MDDLLDSDINKSELSFIQIFQKIWLQPTFVFRKTKGRLYTKIAILLFLFSSFDLNECLDHRNYFSQGVIPSVVLLALTGLAVGLFTALFSFIIGHIQKGPATFRQLIKVSGLSTIPTICSTFFLDLPFSIYSNLQIKSEGLSNAFVALSTTYNILVFIAAIWSIFIFYKGIKVVQQFSRKKALLNVIATYIIIILCVTAMIYGDMLY